jgi:hypothetical protein
MPAQSDVPLPPRNMRLGCICLLARHKLSRLLVQRLKVQKNKFLKDTSIRTKKVKTCGLYYKNIFTIVSEDRK